MSTALRRMRNKHFYSDGFMLTREFVEHYRGSFERIFRNAYESDKSFSCKDSDIRTGEMICYVFIAQQPLLSLALPDEIRERVTMTVPKHLKTCDTCSELYESAFAQAHDKLDDEYKILPTLKTH